MFCVLSSEGVCVCVGIDIIVIITIAHIREWGGGEECVCHTHAKASSRAFSTKGSGRDGRMEKNGARGAKSRNNICPHWARAHTGREKERGGKETETQERGEGKGGGEGEARLCQTDRACICVCLCLCFERARGDCDWGEHIVRDVCMCVFVYVVVVVFVMNWW